ncbi:MAG: LPS assembly lipoprotein LptE [Pikeienuella sp.]
MSFCNRRFFTLAGLAALGGCGFQPVHRSGGAASALRGRIRLANPTSPLEYAFTERMKRRIGSDNGAEYQLITQIDVQETGVAIQQNLDVTRINLRGTVTYAVHDVAGVKTAVSGLAKASAAYDALSEPYATLTAKRAAEERLARELAELVSAQILAAADKLVSS